MIKCFNLFQTEEYEEEEDATEEKDDVENLKDTPSVSRARMTSPERLAAPLTQENHQVKHVAEESRRKERRREGLVQERIISVSEKKIFLHILSHLHFLFIE